MAGLLDQNLTDEEKKRLWGTISSYGSYQPGGTPIQEQNIYTQPMEGTTIPNNYDPNQARIEALNSIAPKVQTPATMNRLTQYTANQLPPTPTTPDVWQGPNYYPGTVSSPEEQARNQAWAEQLQIGRIMKTVPTYSAVGGPQGVKYDQSGTKEVPDYTARMLAQQRPELAAARNQQKELNLPPDIDTFGLQKMGQAYMTPEGRGQLAAYLGTPQGAKEFNDFWTQRKMTAPNIYNFVPTAEGFIPGNIRTGGLGKPSGIGKPMTNEMVTAGQQIGTLQETLDRVKNIYNKNYVGPIAGRLSNIAENTVGLKPEQAGFYSDLAQIQNSLIYLMSGKQINEQEYKRLQRQLPDRNLPPSVFESRMTNFEKTLKSIMGEREKRLGGYGGSTNQSQRIVIGTGIEKGTGKRVIRYSDGEVDYE